MPGKSPRSEVMRNRDFPPQAIQILGDVLRNKEKSRLFKYIYLPRTSRKTFSRSIFDKYQR